jgi:hypothetical protein
MRDDPATHQVDEQGREACLHDVTAKHDYDAPFSARRRGDRVDDRAKVARDENVRERVEERAKRPVIAGGMREFGRADFVRAPGDWNRSDSREIRLASR